MVDAGARARAARLGFAPPVRLSMTETAPAYGQGREVLTPSALTRLVRDLLEVGSDFAHYQAILPTPHSPGQSLPN